MAAVAAPVATQAFALWAASDAAAGAAGEKP